MAWVTARPSGPRAADKPTIGVHRAIPAPPPPPLFKPRGTVAAGKTNGDVLRTLAALSADIDRFVNELDNYSARCTDYFLEVLAICIDNELKKSQGQRPGQIPKSGPAPSNASIEQWAETLKQRAAVARKEFQERSAGLNQLSYRQAFSGLYGQSATIEDALAYIANVRSELPVEFEKLAKARFRHLNTLLRLLKEIA